MSYQVEFTAPEAAVVNLLNGQTQAMANLSANAALASSFIHQARMLASICVANAEPSNARNIGALFHFLTDLGEWADVQCEDTNARTNALNELNGQMIDTVLEHLIEENAPKESDETPFE